MGGGKSPVRCGECLQRYSNRVSIIIGPEGSHPEMAEMA
jgi:hypothetical protein